MSNNIKVCLIGAGYMAKEYYKVLSDMNIETIVIGRGKNSAAIFEQEMNHKVFVGGIEGAIKEIKIIPKNAIIAVGVEELKETTLKLLKAGVKNILVEKPAGMNIKEIVEIVELSKKKEASIYVAYNRRFYSSVEKALEIIKQDGGVKSFNFEFTEWGYVLENLEKSKNIKEKWLLANSTHVIDLAFYLGGYPEEMISFIAGQANWHPSGAIYSGAGKTKEGMLFSYQANWNAPGRWGIEVLTNKHRLYFRPLEKLQIQNIGSIKLEDVILNDERDISFKPGIYKMINKFLIEKNKSQLLKIEEHLKNMEIYKKISGYDI